MFESISISTQNAYEKDSPIDIGMLVECMLFYQKTIIVSNRIILTQLINYFGVDRLVILIQEGLLKITFTESWIAIHTQPINGINYHEAIEFTSPQHTFQEDLRKICIGILGKEGKGRRQALKIQDKINVTQHDSIILEGTRKSILDQVYIESAAKTIISELVPGIGNLSEVKFNTEKTQNGIQVFTNIKFDELNKLYHERVSIKHSSLSPAFILSHLLNVEKELYFSSRELSELASSKLSAKLAGKKVDYIIEKSKKSVESLTNFTSFLFNDAKAIREAVNSNSIDLDKLMEVLLKTKEFKKWIVNVDLEDDLIKKYHEEVTKISVLDKLPNKFIRWCIFTGLGVVADSTISGGIVTPISMGFGALDTFYLDKLIKGWKPNQFIDDEIKNKLLE